jgi:hypothetical protein
MKGIFEGMKKYNEEREVLCEEHAYKDDDGKSIIISNAYQMKDERAFNEDLEILNDKHKVDEFLDEEVDADVHMISEECIPVSLPQSFYMGILLMVDDEEPEPQTEETE